MRPIRFAAALVLTGLLSAFAAAQDPAPGDVPPGGPPSDEAQKKALGQFDADADGKLSDDEIGMAREFMQALRRAVGDRLGDRGDRGPRGPRRWRADGQPPEGPPDQFAAPDRGPGERRFDRRRPEGDRPPGDRPPGRRFRGRDGEQGPPPLGEAPQFEPGPRPEGPDGPPRPGRPPGPPPRPMELFADFDANDDDQLSRDEFEKLMGHMREHRPGPPGRPQGDGPIDGPRFGPPGRPPGDDPGPGSDDGPRRPRREGRRPPRPGPDDSAGADQRPPVEVPVSVSDSAA